MSNLSKIALSASLCELLDGRPLDKITIKDITDRCGLTRNTFYYHYHDVYELLDDIFNSKADAILSRYEKDDGWDGGFLECLNFLFEKKNMVYHIYKSNDRDKMENYLGEMIYRHAKIIVSKEFKRYSYPEKVLNLSIGVYKNLHLGIVTEWIQRGMNKKPEQMEELCKAVFYGTTEAVFGSINKMFSS